MLRVVVDTNTLVSATISRGNEYELLKLAILGKIKLVLSPQILQEFKQVISRAKFGFSSKQIEDVLKQIISISEIIIPSIKLCIIKKDPADNKFLECAVQSKADYIVSGDKHLLNLKEFRGVKIIRSKEILSLL